MSHESCYNPSQILNRSAVSLSSLGLNAKAPSAHLSFMQQVLGTITDVFNVAGTRIGDPISVVISYDPSATPAGFRLESDGATFNRMSVLNGDGASLPFEPWVNIA